jgi:hypothetical protein
MSTNGNGNAPAERWRLNKEISVSNLIVLAVYGAASIWFMSNASARLDQSEEINRQQAVAIARLDDANRIMAERLARIEVLGEVTQRKLDQIDRKIPETSQ